MNYSTAVFLINKTMRAVLADYENQENGHGPNYKKVMFKTLDASIKVGDLCVVPTDTRHKMTVVKVTDVDVNVDFDDATQVKWIIQRVDHSSYDQVLKDEAVAVETIKRAEFRKRRQTLLDDIVADDRAEIVALPLYVNGQPKGQAAAPQPSPGSAADVQEAPAPTAGGRPLDQR
jgi:predicted Mrr-cat superfamily restriction endonuclease